MLKLSVREKQMLKDYMETVIDGKRYDFLWLGRFNSRYLPVKDIRHPDTPIKQLKMREEIDFDGLTLKECIQVFTKKLKLFKNKIEERGENRVYLCLTKPILLSCFEDDILYHGKEKDKIYLCSYGAFLSVTQTDTESDELDT